MEGEAQALKSLKETVKFSSSILTPKKRHMPFLKTNGGYGRTYEDRKKYTLHILHIVINIL